MQRAILLSGLILVTLGSQTVSAAPAARSPSPARFELTVADVARLYGGGFTVIMSRTVSNSEANAYSSTVGQSASAYAAHGRLTGYVVGYAKVGVQQAHGNNVFAPGVNQVSSGINQYRSVAGAAWEYNYALAHPTPPARGVTQKVSTLLGLGDAARLITYHLRSRGGKGLTYGVIVNFRRSRYTAMLDIGAQGIVTAGDALRLARKLDNRLVRGG